MPSLFARSLAMTLSLALCAACTPASSPSTNASGAASSPEYRSTASAQEDQRQSAPTQAQAIPAPDNVAAPPEGEASVTESGLASLVLTAGDGEVHPNATSVVKVHYTGWTTDGEMFDSSVVRGEPLSFPLDQVIPGWQEGVMLMVEGETRRFWIPAELAYEGRSGPQGTLVFDVQLLAIEEL